MRFAVYDAMRYPKCWLVVEGVYAYPRWSNGPEEASRFPSFHQAHSFAHAYASAHARIVPADPFPAIPQPRDTEGPAPNLDDLAAAPGFLPDGWAV